MASVKTSYIKTLPAEEGLNETDIAHQVAVCFDVAVVFLLLRVPREGKQPGRRGRVDVCLVCLYSLSNEFYACQSIHEMIQNSTHLIEKITIFFFL